MIEDCKRIVEKTPLVELLNFFEMDERVSRLPIVLHSPFLILDGDGKLRFISSAARELFGYSNKDPIPDYQITRDANFAKAELSSLLKPALSGEQVFMPIISYKFTRSSLAKTPTEEERRLRFSFFPVRDIDSKVYFVAKVERIEDEAKSQPLMLLQRSESASMLARGIAHEFNNIFASIKGVASLIKLDLDPSHSSYHYISQLEDLVERGVKLIKDLTNYVRITAPKLELMKVEDYFEHFRSLASLMVPRGVELDVEIHTSGTFKVDIKRLDHCFFNLLHNAIEAVQDSPTKKIRVRADKPSGEQWEKELLGDAMLNMIRVMVEDSGPGIPEDIYPRIFEPYFTTKLDKRSSGLGLNVSQQIVAEHCGYIVAQPKGELGGARFVVFLPLAEESSSS